jgi:acylaminoacyl-peptidase
VEGVEGRPEVWIATADGRERRKWADGWSPRWSPDGGRIAWVTERGGRTRLRIRGVEKAAETEVESEGAPAGLAWSAEGDAIAFTMPVAQPAPSWAPPAILNGLRRPPAILQVFVAPAGGGAAKQVSRAKTGCRGEPSWALDGRSVIAVCDGAIVALGADGGEGKTLAKEAGEYDSPIVSPDGGRIAYLFTERRAQSYTIRKLWVMNADGSRARPLSGSLDRDATAPQWSSESRTVYFLADDRGATHVYAARNDGTVRQATSRPEQLEGLSLADDGRAATVRRSATEGGDVATFTVDVVSHPATVAAPNEHLLAERQIGPVEEIKYRSDGREIQAWLVKPPGFDGARKYPLVVDAADDPRRMYGAGFSLRAQILAAGGWVALCANPRGTPGYGEEFGNLLRTRYPGDDFDDLMRGVEAAIAKGGIDEQRVAIVGGLTAAWAIGHTMRFRRAVARRPIVDWTLDPERAAAALGAMPWDDPELTVKRSPVFFAKSFATPTLVLADEADAQAELLYRALQARRVESALVRTGNAAAELDAVLAWIAK